MSQLPAHLQHRQKRDLAVAAVGGISSGSPAHISIAGNRFTLVDDAGNEKPIQTLFLDVCVIDANSAVSKIYFDPRVPFEPGGDNSNPPICWSDNGIGASAQASVPQNTSCQICPHNTWGSATSKATGKPTKACNDVKKVAVVAPGIDMVFLLRIPPASLKNWGKYCQTLGGHGVDLPDAMTRLEFESQGILKFTPVGYVDEATAKLTDKAIAAKATDTLIGLNDRPWGGQGDQQKIAYAKEQAAPQIAQDRPAAAAMPPPQPLGGQGATPFGGGVSTVAPPSTTQEQPFIPPGVRGASPSSPFGQGQPSTSSQTDATPPKTRKPRAKADPTPPIDDGLPPFLRRDPSQAPSAQLPNPTQFGMTPNAPAPDAGVQAALDAAFRLPT